MWLTQFRNNFHIIILSWSINSFHSKTRHPIKTNVSVGTATKPREEAVKPFFQHVVGRDHPEPPLYSWASEVRKTHASNFSMT